MSFIDPRPKRRLVPEGIEERFANVQGHRMRYLTAGSGPALLLIHGLMGFSFSFSENLGPLSKNFTVYAPDLLNAGYSDRADVASDLRSLVLQICAFMDAVGIERVDILGSSYGGTLAMALAAMVPERVRAVVPVAPAHCDSERRTRWQVWLFSGAAGSWISRLMRFAPPILHSFFIKRMYGDASRILPGTISEYARAIAVPGTTVAAAKVLIEWKASFEQFCEMMPQIAQRNNVHLIWGDRDHVVPLKTAKALLKRMPAASLSIISTAGHLPYEELPEEFNKVLLKLLLTRPQEIRAV